MSAYQVAIFHLVTHAFFKALLFLGAGSVIVALHHKQDMRNMGGLAKKMPITYFTFVIGTLALVGFPGFAGFYSKDMIIEAAHFSNMSYSYLIYLALLSGVFITSFYSFRLLFMVFHSKVNLDKKDYDNVKESPKVITIPLIMLAIPSVIVGYILIEPMLFAGSDNWLIKSIFISDINNVFSKLSESFLGASAMITHSFVTPPFWLMLFGAISAYLFIVKYPHWSDIFAKKLAIFYKILLNKYGFDKLYLFIFRSGIKNFSSFLWRKVDMFLIDGLLVNGTAKIVAVVGSLLQKMQTGHIYHYVFSIIVGLILLLAWFVNIF